MQIIEYTNGQEHTDYAPESYLNQGAVILSRVECREYETMLERVRARELGFRIAIHSSEDLLE